MTSVPATTSRSAPQPALADVAPARRRTRLRPKRGRSPFGGPALFRRESDPELSALLSYRVAVIALFAAAVGREARHLVLTSRMRRATDEEILQDLIAAFARMKHSRAFRKVPAAAWAFADHDRPHLHLVVVLPPGVTIRDIRRAWRAGITPHPRAVYDGPGLGSYFAAQRAAGDAKLPSRHRFHGWREPSAEHFTSENMGKTYSPLPLLLPFAPQGEESAPARSPGCAPSCAPRAAAGGDTGSASATTGEASATRSRRRASAGERPQAEGRSATATGGAEVGLESPPRRSEPAVLGDPDSNNC